MRIKFIIGGILLLILVTLFFLSDSFYINKIPQNEKTENVKNKTYLIENDLVTLKNGLSEIEIVPGSASKKVTKYFGNDVIGDLNNDNKPDTVFLLTQESGGSGIFYYVVVMLSSEKGYDGTNAILLGDRIAPQTTEIKDGKIVVNYSDRKVGEPFSVAPSVGVSKYFKIENKKLTEII